MRKLMLIVHTSLDGFVADAKGDLKDFPYDEENLVFVGELTEGADTALFGRVSYQLLESFWPTAKDLPGSSPGTVKYSTWYNQAQRIVFSKTLAAEGLNNTIVLRDNLPGEIIKLKKQAGKDILIFGSPAISQQLMELNLIDEYWIFINAIIFGKGIPLFAGLSSKINLKVEQIVPFRNGEIAIHYSVVR